MGSVLCPACSSSGVLLDFHVHTIPYFGEVMESILVCKNCNYRHVDVQILENKEPCRYILEVIGEEDMSVRVVRSSMGRIVIPELGVKISPGGDSQGFISNIEGVLDRVSGAVRTAMHWSDDEKKKMKAEILLGRIDDIKDGKEKVTVIIEDTSGNSAIISDRALEEKMSITHD